MVFAEINFIVPITYKTIKTMNLSFLLIKCDNMKRKEKYFGIKVGMLKLMPLKSKSPKHPKVGYLFTLPDFKGFSNI